MPIKPKKKEIWSVMLFFCFKHFTHFLLPVLVCEDNKQQLPQGDREPVVQHHGQRFLPLLMRLSTSILPFSICTTAWTRCRFITESQIREFPISSMCVFGLREEAGGPGENPYSDEENMQTLQNTSAWIGIKFTAFTWCSAYLYTTVVPRDCLLFPWAISSQHRQQDIKKSQMSSNSLWETALCDITKGIDKSQTNILGSTALRGH